MRVSKKKVIQFIKKEIEYNNYIRFCYRNYCKLHNIIKKELLSLVDDDEELEQEFEK